VPHRRATGAHDALQGEVEVFKLTIGEGTPISPELRGKQAVVDLLMNLGDVLEFRQEVPLEHFVGGDRVVVFGREAYTGARPTATAAATLPDRMGLAAAPARFPPRCSTFA
jgi:hypothetical protein